MKHPPLILTLCSIFFSGCYSYRIFPAASRSFSYDGPRTKAFVINPTLKKEYSILAKSTIFDLTNDSLDSSAIKIKLFPIEKSYVCGQAAIVSLFSLGQFPVLMPDKYRYVFQEIYPADSQFRSYELTLATRYWFWDAFAFNKDFEGKAGKILGSKYLSKQKEETTQERNERGKNVGSTLQ